MFFNLSFFEKYFDTRIFSFYHVTVSSHDFEEENKSYPFVFLQIVSRASSRGFQKNNKS